MPGVRPRRGQFVLPMFLATHPAKMPIRGRASQIRVSLDIAAVYAFKPDSASRSAGSIMVCFPAVTRMARVSSLALELRGNLNYAY